MLDGIKRQANLDQQAAALEQLARYLWCYYDILIAVGFDESIAVALVCEMQDRLLGGGG